MTIADRRVAVPDVVVAGSTIVLAVAVLLSRTLLPWYRLEALDTVVATEGAGLFGGVMMLFALSAAALTLANRRWGDRWPALPFKRTSFPVAFALLAVVACLAAVFLGRDVGGFSYENAVGTQVALLAGLGLLVGTILDFVADPDPFIT